ncbi:OV-16 antigen [Caerostris darwini]|uniref:OV-16 antigen n=1 Tax=Caerostris darwini TaxID=1538125 RepID=A0AAV4NKL8_9ARAC|nr:OV-16 antigen [Caerostris darwini]
MTVLSSSPRLMGGLSVFVFVKQVGISVTCYKSSSTQQEQLTRRIELELEDSVTMFQLVCQLFLVLPICILAQDGECDLSSFLTCGLVPDLIPKVPEKPLTIEYDGHSVTCGTELNCNITQNTPTKVSFEADEAKCYTLIMFDPDYPSRQNSTLSCFRHWLLENIEGGIVSNGIEISPYHPPDPPVGSGYHRYIFLVYEQPENSELYDFCDDTIRTNFDMAGFVQERNLLGPISSFFKTNRMYQLVTVVQNIFFRIYCIEFITSLYGRFIKMWYFPKFINVFI